MQIKTDSYKLMFEETLGELFVHLDVYEWTPSAYKQMLLDLEDIKAAAGRTLYCCINKLESFKIKLAQMFGFIPVYEIEDNFIMELK